MKERAKDLVGKLVRLRREVRTVGGVVFFPKWKLVTVYSTWRGRFNLQAGPLGDTVRRVARNAFNPIVPGVCFGCGCTEDRACFDGCSWTDKTESLCTGCTA